MTIDSLVSLINEIEKLEPKNVILLQKEFLKRNELERAALIEKFIESTTIIPISQEKSSIESIVSERLQMGESIESIEYDLKKKGIDIGKIVQDDLNMTVTDKNIKKTISQLKEKGLNDTIIKTELNKLYGIDENDFQKFLNRNRKRGKTVLVIGIVFLIVWSFFLVVTAQSRKMEFSTIAIIGVLSGIGMIIGGLQEMKINK